MSGAKATGYAVDDDSGWVTAGQLAEAWLAPDGARRVHDGYHAGIASDPTQGFVAGGDPLGMFPLYHAALPGGATIVASTPEAIACHPEWSWRLDRRGLAESATSARFCWSGIPMDWVFEPVSEYNGYDLLSKTWSRTAFLEQINAWGVPAATLPVLLGSDGDALCEDVIQRLVAACEAGPLPPERQSALLRWDQRVRNHLASALHLTSFAVWPLMIATDRRFFTAAFSLPVATCRDRGIEKAILLRRCPDLAAIPLDTNSFRFDPLQPRAHGPGMVAMRSLLRQIRRVLQPLVPGSDPRRYERLFNVDMPRWQAVRRAAEPLRPLLEEHLDASTLARIMPPSTRRLRSRKPLSAGSPIRLLAGLAVVLAQRRL